MLLDGARLHDAGGPVHYHRLGCHVAPLAHEVITQYVLRWSPEPLCPILRLRLLGAVAFVGVSEEHQVCNAMFRASTKPSAGRLECDQTATLELHVHLGHKTHQTLEANAQASWGVVAKGCPHQHGCIRLCHGRFRLPPPPPQKSACRNNSGET